MSSPPPNSQAIPTVRSYRPAGLAALQSSTKTSSLFSVAGASLRRSHSDALATQLEVFRSLLTHFSHTHMQQIREDPKFRAEFGRMCALIGVDPLASSRHSDVQAKGGRRGLGSFWSEIMGVEGGGKSFNDFYFSLGVRIVEICRATRASNGGLVAIAQLVETMNAERVKSGGETITEDDIVRAVATLEPVSPGFTVMQLGGKTMLRSIPKELNMDQARVIEAIGFMGGYVSTQILVDNMAWERARAQNTIDDLIADGLVWMDDQVDGGEPEFWSPAAIEEELD